MSHSNNISFLFSFFFHLYFIYFYDFSQDFERSFNSHLLSLSFSFKVRLQGRGLFYEENLRPLYAPRSGTLTFSHTLSILSLSLSIILLLAQNLLSHYLFHLNNYSNLNRTWASDRFGCPRCYHLSRGKKEMRDT